MQKVNTVLFSFAVEIYYVEKMFKLHAIHAPPPPPPTKDYRPMICYAPNAVFF